MVLKLRKERGRERGVGIQKIRVIKTFSTQICFIKHYHFKGCGYKKNGDNTRKYFPDKFLYDHNLFERYERHFINRQPPS